MARGRPRRPATAWATLLIVLGLMVLAGCVYVLPRVLVPDRSASSLAAVDDAAKRLELEDARLNQRNDVRTTLLQGLAGAVVAVGLSLTWRQIRVNQEGQITERFNKAIDHLGSDKLDLRLGGIYALERIAKNSEEDGDTIAEVLTAFVRQHSPRPPSQPGQDQGDSRAGRQRDLRTRAADIQAVLTVLGRGGFTRQGAFRLDLVAVDLRGAALRGAHLEAAYLNGADLRDADLAGADLRGAVVIGADLRGAILSWADLRGASLIGADLRGAILVETYLDDADLAKASLHMAYLHDAHLNRASLYETILTGANLEGADLQGAGLQGTYLQDASLEGAHLQGAVADTRTVWPDGFDAMSNGIEIGEYIAGQDDAG